MLINVYECKKYVEIVIINKQKIIEQEKNNNENKNYTYNYFIAE